MPDRLDRIGKPEPLRFDFRGYWSSRIEQENRLVYAFDEIHLTLIRCRFELPGG